MCVFQVSGEGDFDLQIIAIICEILHVLDSSDAYVRLESFNLNEAVRLTLALTILSRIVVYVLCRCKQP